MKILLIEDDIQLNTTIKAFLEFKGYKVVALINGDEALTHIDMESFDLYIIDVNLPSINGLDLITYVRNKNLTVPIIMITASLEVDNLKTAYKNGCNEYIKKPFHLDELEIRINNILNKSIDNIVSLTSNVLYDLEFEELQIDNEVVKLRKKERRLLTLLLQSINHTVTYERIEDYVWENEIKDIYPLRQLVAELKKSFQNYSHLIVTDRGKGYKILEEK